MIDLCIKRAYKHRNDCRHRSRQLLVQNFYLRLFSHVKKKIKVIPVTGSGDPYGFETSSLQHFLDNRLTDDSGVVRLAPAARSPGRFLVLTSVRG
jgi:hypothetical protein